MCYKVLAKLDFNQVFALTERSVSSFIVVLIPCTQCLSNKETDTNTA